jgi:hypothetical protein
MSDEPVQVQPDDTVAGQVCPRCLYTYPLHENIHNCCRNGVNRRDPPQHWELAHNVLLDEERDHNTLVVFRHVKGTERVYIQDRFPDKPGNLFYEDRYQVMQQNLQDLGALSYLGCFNTLGEAIDRIYTWMNDHPYGIDDNTLAHYGKRYGPHGDEIIDHDEYQRRYPDTPL